MPLTAIAVAECEFGHAQRTFGNHECGDFAARQRGDTLGEIQRRLAGSIACVALDGADPVYRACNG